MKKIMFICFGNAFRSLTAEYCFKKFLDEKKANGFEVKSAGIAEGVYRPHKVSVETLSELGIDVTKHKHAILTKKMIDDNNLIVAMSRSVQDDTFKKFGVKIPLFLEICFGTEKSIDDDVDFDHLKDKDKDDKEIEEFITNTTFYINDCMPYFYKGVLQRLV